MRMNVPKIKNPGLRRDVSFQNELFVSLDSLIEPNGFWHVSFSCQRAGLLSGRQARSLCPGRFHGTFLKPAKLTTILAVVKASSLWYPPNSVR